MFLALNYQRVVLKPMVTGDPQWIEKKTETKGDVAPGQVHKFVHIGSHYRPSLGRCHRKKSVAKITLSDVWRKEPGDL